MAETPQIQTTGEPDEEGWEGELLELDYESNGTRIEGKLPRGAVDRIIAGARDLGWLERPPVERVKGEDGTATRIRLDLDGDESGRSWACGLPNVLGLPREYQGLASHSRPSPSEALRGLADLMDETAQCQLGEALGRVQDPPELPPSLFTQQWSTIEPIRWPGSAAGPDAS